jgi:hypothetical protein
MMLFAPVALLLSAATAGAVSTPASTTDTDRLAVAALGKLGVFYAGHRDHGTCSVQNAAVRREW